MMMHGKLLEMAAFALTLVFLLGCEPDLTVAEEDLLREMELSPGQAPLSPTNAYADDPEAAAFGRLLFFDKGMSADGEVSCSTCHDPAEGWSDPVEVSLSWRREECQLP